MKHTTGAENHYVTGLTGLCAFVLYLNDVVVKVGSMLAEMKAIICTMKRQKAAMGRRRRTAEQVAGWAWIFSRTYTVWAPWSSKTIMMRERMTNHDEMMIMAV